MVVMRIEKEAIERMQQLGAEWIQAIAAETPEQLERFCQPDVTSYLQTPRRTVTLDTAADLVAKFQQWFGASRNIRVEHSRVEMVGERLGIFYRLLLQEQEHWRVVEQQLYCTLQDGRIAQLNLLCSGFQPVSPGAPDDSASSSLGDGLLVIRTGAADSGSTCAVLTPAIKSRLREMLPGQVLEVRVDDPSAREDIEVWCRLSGNRLLAIREVEGAELCFLVRKKE